MSVMGSPPLTERRRAATLQDISFAAAELFGEHGVEGTTAADIAAAAGVSLRTFYRYLRTKEEAVAPLLSTGAESWRKGLDAVSGRPLDTAVETAIKAALDPMTDPAHTAPTALTRQLLIALDSDPEMAAVWHRVNGESEAALRTVLARHDRGRMSTLDLRLIAAAATTSIRVALEHWAGDPDAGDPGLVAVECYRRLRGIRPTTAAIPGSRR